MAQSGTLRSTNPGDRRPAQRALVRILETTIPDRAVWERALATALHDARLDDVPEEFDPLLSFVRGFLVRRLDDGERPWVVSSLLEDLEAEAEVARLGPDAAKSARLAVATRIPDKLPITEPAPASGAPLAEGPRIPKLEPLPADLQPLDRLQIERPAVLLVDGDRFGRSALSRALVQGRCDVTTLDGRDEAVRTIEGPDPIDVLILDVDTAGAPAILEALVRVRPDTPVIAWTNATQAVAEHVTRVAGVERFLVLPRSARPAQMNEAVRKLC